MEAAPGCDVAHCNINNIIDATCAAARRNHANLKDKVINWTFQLLICERGHAGRLIWPFQIVSLFSIINEKLPAGLKCLDAFLWGRGA